jgi:preprotein translocase subunit SecD
MLIAMGIVFGLLALTIALGKSPKLGLDLQGGVSVNLQPVEDGEVTSDVSEERLDQAIAIIRKRVDALGVAEPEVSRQGSTITVQLPGATNQKDVLDVVGKTAELQFRPVLAGLGSVPTDAEREEAQGSVEELRAELGLPEGVTANDVFADEQAKQAAAAGATTTTVPGQAPADPTATTAPPTETTVATEGNGGGRSRPAVRQGGTTTTTAPAETTTTVPAAPTTTPTPLNQWGVDVTSETFQNLFQAESTLQTEVTDNPGRDDTVVLVDADGNAYRLGPTELTGRAVEDATAGLSQNGQWVVNPVFRSGEDGIDAFNALAAKCFAGSDPTCPKVLPGADNGAVAIVLDGEVLTAPSINVASFARDQIEISGSFDQDSAQAVAVALRFGSLPVELEPQQAETVSATLGEEALRAGGIAGAIGLLLVFVFLFVYYRRLTLVTLASLSTSAALLWVLMSWLGATVTLAGVVGLVVSIGIAIDSSVVSFEGLKEDVRNGATFRSVAERSMGRSYSTILKADASSLIGAGVLWWLSVGPVRGFAFYLGAATLLDLFSALFVLRPGILTIARSGWARQLPKLGIPVDDLDPQVREKVAVPTGAEG